MKQQLQVILSTYFSGYHTDALFHSFFNQWSWAILNVKTSLPWECMHWTLYVYCHWVYYIPPPRPFIRGIIHTCNVEFFFIPNYIHSSIVFRLDSVIYICALIMMIQLACKWCVIYLLILFSSLKHVKTFFEIWILGTE